MQASIVPNDTHRHVHASEDVDVYVVLDEFPTGRVWRELDEELATEAAVIQWIVDGQFEHPVRVVAFNAAEGWSKDVTEGLALRLLELSREGRTLSASARDFVERVTGQTASAIV